jgi:Cytochrome P450
LIYLLPNIFPKYTARKAYQGRQRVVNAFKEYFQITPTLEKTSALTMCRWNSYMVENDIGMDAMARVEGSLAFGLLVNSVPTTFWTIFEIYKRPELLRELRQEVAENALHIEATGSQKLHIIDLSSIRKRCPHLVSTFQETLRLRMKGSLVRMIMKDTLLDPQNANPKDQYLLKEGSLLQVTAGHFNQSPEYWGSDALNFNSKRFMELTNTSKARQGFLAFGTAPNTCPGRQFASGEILSLVAMLILRYDIAPVGEEWIEPEVNTTSLSAAVMPPKGRIMVKVKARDEFKGREWQFRVGEDNGRFNLIIG